MIAFDWMELTITFHITEVFTHKDIPHVLMVQTDLVDLVATS